MTVMHKQKWDFEPENKEAKRILATLEKFLAKHYGTRCKRTAIQCPICEVWCLYDLVKVKLL